MILCKYEDITIEKIEDITETEQIKEIIFDADNETVEISEEYKEILDTILDACNQIRKALEGLGSVIIEIGTNMQGYLKKLQKHF